MDEEQGWGERIDHRRHKIVERAIQAADEIIMEGSSGEVEETDYLTGAVALKFVEKVHGRLQSAVLRMDLENQDKKRG